MLEVDKQMALFAPYSLRKIGELKAGNLDLVHYTSASNALRILRTKRVTLRNASLMNDFSEIDHGERCLQAAWSSDLGAGNQNSTPGRLRALLQKLSPTIAPAVEQQYNQHLQARKLDTFLLSLSEHDDRREGEYGKLSMWRAYGGRTNVAMVVDMEMLERDTVSGAFTTPVIYSRVENFTTDIFAELVEALEKYEDELLGLDRDHVVHYLGWALNSLAMSTKHPGFIEEKEWRIIYAPWLYPDANIKREIIEIHGVPQAVHGISLDPDPNSDRAWMTIPSLLKKIIIGPTENPWVLFDAFVSELEKIGVPNAADRVVVSNIPIRR